MSHLVLFVSAQRHRVLIEYWTSHRRAQAKPVLSYRTVGPTSKSLSFRFVLNQTALLSRTIQVWSSPTGTMAPSEETLQQVNKDALLRIASSLCGGSPCHFVGDPITQSSCTILVIRFPKEDRSWAARIPEDQEYSFLDICVIPLECVALNFPNIPAPRLHGYFDAGAKGDNPVGVAYMLVDWIEGKHMPAWSLTSPTVSIRQKVLDQLAEMMLEILSTKEVKGNIHFYGMTPAQLSTNLPSNLNSGVPDDTPKHTPVSTTVWLTESIDRGLRRNLRQKNTSTVIDYLIQRSMIPRYTVPEHVHSPWVFMHPDLHNANIIIDDDYNIKG